MNFEYYRSLIIQKTQTSNMSRTFSFQNQFSVLDEQKHSSKSKQQQKPKRRRRMEAFPRLPGSSKTPTNVTQLSYNNLIPSLNAWKMKSTSSSSSRGNDSSYGKPYYVTTSEEDEDENSDRFNQVWCVEKDKKITFDSDLYPEEDTDSFTYESDNSNGF